MILNCLSANIWPWLSTLWRRWQSTLVAWWSWIVWRVEIFLRCLVWTILLREIGLAQIIAGFSGLLSNILWWEYWGDGPWIVYSVYVIAGAAVIAVVAGFVSEISALLNSIPTLSWEAFHSPSLEWLHLAVWKSWFRNKIRYDNKKNLLVQISDPGIKDPVVWFFPKSGAFKSLVSQHLTILRIMLYQILPETKSWRGLVCSGVSRV